MQLLTLPEFDIKVKDQDVFCLVRKKWVALTPEEWVRQHFLNLLIVHLNYPKGLMRIEHSLHYFKNQRRSDITVLDKDSGIFLLVECKAPFIPIDQRVVNQISEYNKILKAKYIATTNGIKHFIWEKEKEKYHQLKDFPIFH